MNETVLKRSPVFESRRRANAQEKAAQNAAAVLAIFALLLLLLGFVTSWPVAHYISLLLFVGTGIALASGSGTWGVGATGEETVAKYLHGLGDGFHIIHDVFLLGAGGNIDHVVLGPNGVFVVETKNHKGVITCDGDCWTQRKVGQRGTPYMGNIGFPSKQVKRNAFLLRDLIRNRLGRNLYVNSVVVFTNKEAFLRIDNPTVAITRPGELCQVIRTFNSGMILNAKELEELETTIRPHSHFHQ